MPDGDKFYWGVKGTALLSEFPSVSLAQQSLARQLDLPASVVADRLVGLYRRHCDEWCRFPGSLLAQLGRKAA